MSKSKEEKINALANIVNELGLFRDMYAPASSAWVLVNACIGHIHSVYHLQTKTDLLDYCHDSMNEVLEKV